MTDGDGWRPLKRPANRLSNQAAAFVVTPFGKLARTHTLSAIGDGAVTLALAGSIFFSVSPTDARVRVAGYLLLTMAPFAIVTPLIGPAIDRVRSGRRLMIVATVFTRSVLAFLMIGEIDSLLLFPLAFGILVLQKGYAVGKSAVVPTLVEDSSQLVDANAKLSLLGALGGMAGAAIGGMAVLIGGPGYAAAAGMVVFAVAGASALRLPAVAVAPTPVEPDERAELRSTSILLAGSAMGIIRGVVGFVTFLLAFEFRGGEDGIAFGAEGAAVGVAGSVARGVDVLGEPGAPAWHFGVVVAMAGVGALAGARVAPQLRRGHHEERILLGALAAISVVAVFGALSGDLFGAALVSLTVAMCAGAGKLVFDSIVQRDAPDANYGRSFSRFEARFQISWVVGAFVAVVSPIRSLSFGFAVIAAAATFAFVSYLVGSRGGRVDLTRRIASRVAPGRVAPVPPSEADEGTLDRGPEPAVDQGETPAEADAAPDHLAADGAAGWGGEHPPPGSGEAVAEGVEIDVTDTGSTGTHGDEWVPGGIDPVITSGEGIEVTDWAVDPDHTRE